MGQFHVRELLDLQAAVVAPCFAVPCMHLRLSPSWPPLRIFSHCQHKSRFLLQQGAVTIYPHRTPTITYYQTCSRVFQFDSLDVFSLHLIRTTQPNRTCSPLQYVLLVLFMYVLPANG